MLGYVGRETIRTILLCPASLSACSLHEARHGGCNYVYTATKARILEATQSEVTL